MQGAFRVKRTYQTSLNCREFGGFRAEMRTGNLRLGRFCALACIERLLRCIGMQPDRTPAKVVLIRNTGPAPTPLPGNIS